MSLVIREEALIIPGPQGNLEALGAWIPGEHRVGVICHPHPLFHGTMHNKVVFTLTKAFQRRGISSLRFNYRGVGKSEGHYGHSIGEVEDLIAVLAWIKARYANAKFYLAGFSFGAYIAAVAASQEDCAQLFGIAPAVVNQPYLSLAAIGCPWIILQGEEDRTIAPERVYAWYEQAKHEHTDVRLIKIPGATHFFDGQLPVLRTLVEDHLV